LSKVAPLKKWVSVEVGEEWIGHTDLNRVEQDREPPAEVVALPFAFAAEIATTYGDGCCWRRHVLNMQA
jgi:hypothetical protein